MIGFLDTICKKKLGGIFQPVADAFSEIGINLTYYRDDEKLLLPYHPSVFPNDSASLSAYARLYLEPNADSLFLRWHLLNVNYSIDNISQLNTRGVSTDLNNGYNTVTTPFQDRYSMVFWGDIQRFYTDTTTLVNIGVFTTTHELGHQRAGLSDIQGPYGQPQFHNMFIDEDNNFVQDYMNYS